MSRKTMTSSTRSAIGIAVMAVMSIGIIAFSNPLYHALKGPITTNQPEIPLADGTYIHEAPEPDSNGFRDSTRITVSNGIIVSCVWDSFDAEGNGKQKLSMDGHYVMTENGPTWKAQADAVGSGRALCAGAGVQQQGTGPFAGDAGAGQPSGFDQAGPCPSAGPGGAAAF